MNTFKDHFSKQSQEYARYRPGYPVALFDYVLSLVSQRDLAWDCATGSGQVARVLADSFHRVVATDASASQISQTPDIDNVEFYSAPAEASALKADSVDLITVAQAMHWFDFERFHTEVRRVLKPGGILAVWYYGLSTIQEDIDKIVGRYYEDIVGHYWPPERRYIENDYRDIPFPYTGLNSPWFSMAAMWRLDDLLGYLETWSATQRYKVDKGRDPRDQITSPLAEAWGDPERQRPVSWPVSLHVGKIA